MNRLYYIDSSAEVHESAEIGEGTSIWNWSKVREGARIGRNCSIGQCVYVDFDVQIGDGCKVQNGVSVYHGVTLEARVLVGPNATFTNDRIPRAFNADWEVATTLVEEGASIGANATIVCGVRIGRYCVIAAGAVVTCDIAPHTLVMGNPARPVDFVNRRGTRLHWDLNANSPPDDLLAVEA